MPDSSVTVNATPVGPDGFTYSFTSTSLDAVLDSAMIQKFKHMGKVIYEYKLYTDPAAIPPPGTTVKIRGSDRVNISGFGKVTYRISSDN